MHEALTDLIVFFPRLHEPPALRPVSRYVVFLFSRPLRLRQTTIRHTTIGKDEGRGRGGEGGRGGGRGQEVLMSRHAIEALIVHVASQKYSDTLCFSPAYQQAAFFSEGWYDDTSCYYPVVVTLPCDATPPK